MRISDWSSDVCSSDLSRSYNSVNYGVAQYASSIVQPLADACAATELPQPRIVTESGRAMTAHHAVLVANVSEFDAAPEVRVPDAHADATPAIRPLRGIPDHLAARPAAQQFH